MVEKAGGLPVLIPYRSIALVEQYLDLCDGFVLSGGADYDPAAWGESRHPQAVAVDPAREKFDRAIIKAIENRNKPVLGICAGCQIMNLSRGGSLHQFIPDFSDQIEHRRFTIEEWSKRHPVQIDRDSILARPIGATNLSVNSSHKQSINRLGQSLTITARSPDGIVEMIEDRSKPFYVGVQWHPERMLDDPMQQRLFGLLIEAARRSGR